MRNDSVGILNRHGRKLVGNRTDNWVMQSQFADDVIVYAESRDKLGSGSEFREDKGGVVRGVEEGVKDREMSRVVKLSIFERAGLQ